MVKTINITLPDEIHDLLVKIKEEKGFDNLPETLVWIIKKAAGAEVSN